MLLPDLVGDAASFRCRFSAVKPARSWEGRELDLRKATTRSLKAALSLSSSVAYPSGILKVSFNREDPSSDGVELVCLSCVDELLTTFLSEDFEECRKFGEPEPVG